MDVLAGRWATFQTLDIRLPEPPVPGLFPQLLTQYHPDPAYSMPVLVELSWCPGRFPAGLVQTALRQGTSGEVDAHSQARELGR